MAEADPVADRRDEVVKRMLATPPKPLKKANTDREASPVSELDAAPGTGKPER